MVKIKNLTVAERKKVKTSFVPLAKASNLQEASSPDKRGQAVFSAKKGRENSKKTLAVGSCGDDGQVTKDDTRSVPLVSKQEWFANLRHHFDDVVLGGMEISMRKKVYKCIKDKSPLNVKETQAVVNSLNHHIHEYVGTTRPEKMLYRYTKVIQ